jgi:hypothetical protein
MWRRFWATMTWCGDFSMHTALGVSIHGFVEQSEWTPNEYTIQIAAALIRAGARVEAVKMTLAAAVCLGAPGTSRALRRRPAQETYRWRTALHDAVCSGSPDTVKPLVEA